jgi:Ca2+/Na+ antiporter
VEIEVVAVEFKVEVKVMTTVSILLVPLRRGRRIEVLKVPIIAGILRWIAPLCLIALEKSRVCG